MYDFYDPQFTSIENSFENSLTKTNLLNIFHNASNNNHSGLNNRSEFHSQYTSVDNNEDDLEMLGLERHNIPNSNYNSNYTSNSSNLGITRNHNINLNYTSNNSSHHNTQVHSSNMMSIENNHMSHIQQPVQPIQPKSILKVKSNMIYLPPSNLIKIRSQVLAFESCLRNISDLAKEFKSLIDKEFLARLRNNIFDLQINSSYIGDYNSENLTKK